MLKRKSVIAIILSSAMLCGCTFGGRQSGPINEKGSDPSSSTPVADDDEPTLPNFIDGLPEEINILPGLPGDEFLSSEEDQIETIWNNRNKWMFTGRIPEGYYIYYALSDLDGNGRLEVIATESYGDYNFSTYSVYEVNEDGTGLDYVENDIMEGESMPDIEWGEVFYFAKDPDGSILGYLMTDGIRADGGSAYMVNTDFVTMKDGRISYEYIASANTSYDDDGSVSTQYFVDKDGNQLDGWDEFNEYGEKYIKQTYPEAEVKVMVIASIYANETEEADVYDLIKESWRKHGEYDNIEDYYLHEYSQEGAGEDGKGDDWIDRNGELTTRNVTMEDLKNTSYCAFEEYIFETNIYYDYETDTEGFFASTSLNINTDGTGTLYYNGYNGLEEWTLTSISYEDEPFYYAYATFKNGDYELNSVMQFYYFTYEEGGDPIEVIGVEFGEEYIYFWPVG